MNTYKIVRSDGTVDTVEADHWSHDLKTDTAMFSRNSGGDTPSGWVRAYKSNEWVCIIRTELELTPMPEPEPLVPVFNPGDIVLAKPGTHTWLGSDVGNITGTVKEPYENVGIFNGYSVTVAYNNKTKTTLSTRPEDLILLPKMIADNFEPGEVKTWTLNNDGTYTVTAFGSVSRGCTESTCSVCKHLNNRSYTDVMAAIPTIQMPL